METVYFTADTAAPEKSLLHRLAAIIRQGGVVALPTDTVYGLAANPGDQDALDKVFAAKGRPQDQPLLLLVDSLQQVEELTACIPLAARKLMAAFWPGPLTLILPGRAELPARVRNARGGVALRLPAQRLCRELIRLTAPLTAPSANLHGCPSSRTAAQVRASFAGRIEAIVDGGQLTEKESTLVDCSGEEIDILRLGAIGEDKIWQALV
jgi:L-threonylcarbamoyladenylate synthase